MRSRLTKISMSVSGGLLVLCLLSLACAPALAGNSAGLAVNSISEETVSAKVAVDYMPMDAPDFVESNEYPEYEFEKLKISPTYQYLRMQPGTEESFTVILENKDSEIISLNPKTVIIPYTENFVDEAWISINPSEKALEPGEKAEFEVRVRVPENADLGNYALVLAFSEKVPEGDVAGFSDFPGTMHLNFEVYVPPTVQILTSSIADLVRTGQSYEYEIELKNTGKEDITVSPEFPEDDYGPVYYKYAPYDGQEEIFGPEAFSIDAPDKVKAGETAVVKLKLKVPSGAKGSYNGYLDLNIEDPGIRDHEENIYLNFRILPSPKEPYVITFYANTEGPITIDLQSTLYEYGLYRHGEKADYTPSFTVSLKDPSGKTVAPVLAGSRYSNSVSIGETPYPVPYPMPLLSMDRELEISSRSGGEVYQSGSTTYVESYTVPGTTGEWTLSILPENVENFEYSISIGPATE